MRTVLPGKPQAKLQAVSTVQWEGKRLIVSKLSDSINNDLHLHKDTKVYISGNALVILGGPHDLIQTVYHHENLDLDAVIIDGATGKVAVSNADQTHIYKPYGRGEGALKWSLESSIAVTGITDAAVTLSWGSNAELLLGASSLKLYQTNANNGLIWDHNLPKPVKYAEFSHDASLVASTGQHDRLVKLWRRQTFGADDTRFDFRYLQHPTSVTGIHWQKPHIHEHHVDSVLFSICADSKIRIWAAADPHCVHALQLWGQIDMQKSIQPRLPDPVSRERYAFFIDSTDLAFATDQAMKDAPNNTERENHALEHLREVAKNNPEVCVVVDECWNMSAWGLENIGNKARKPTDIFNVAHVDNFKLPFLHNMRPEKSNVQFLTFTTPHSEHPVILLSHHFDGRILWSECKLDHLFDPSPNRNRLTPKAVWTGHDGTIKKIVRSHSGKSLISRTNDNEGLIWKYNGRQDGLVLTRSSSLDSSTHIHRTLMLREGDFVVCLHHTRISVWDTRAYVACEVSSCEFEIDGQPLCLVQLPNPAPISQSIYLATITSKMESIIWAVDLPGKPPSQFPDQRTEGAGITETCRARVGTEDELAFVLPVDPAGSTLMPSGVSDTFTKDMVISYTYEGMLQAWAAVVEDHGSIVKWLNTSTVKTGITNPSLASSTAIRKTALVDAFRNRLTIWDQTSGQLEYDVTSEFYDTIQDLDWSATPDNQSILAVGYPYKVVMLAQLRYDYLHAGPAWAPIREINIKELTPHPIGDSVWLRSGNLAVGAGNQLFIYDADINMSDHMVLNLSTSLHSNRKLNVFDLVTYLNGILPIFHPQFLTQCVLAGKQEQVRRIILALHKALQFFVAGDELDSFLSLPAEQFYVEQEYLSHAAKKEAGSSYADIIDDEEPQAVTEELAISLNENLAKIALPQLSSHDQIHLAGIIECVATAEKHRRSMDDLAMRYLLIFQQHILRKSQGPVMRFNISWREIVWAFHSGSQDILVDLVSKQFHGRILWEHARESGMFMWMTDLTAVRAQFEVIARNEYTKTDEKNPIHCSLYYLALRKKPVLLGLWRMAAWNREQAGTQRLLKNNFDDPRWKTAALKNAYALLSKRRFEYAAAFFLLADRLQDAVNVCALQLEDMQLAVAVARVYGGDDSPVLHALLEDKILPQAASEGDRWLATWAFWMLGRRDMAVRVLISSVDDLVHSPQIQNPHAKSFLSSDPALVMLYKQLRPKTLQTLRGASAITPRAEWAFVMQNARLYVRMGCDLLALDLVRNWEFLKQPNGNSLVDGNGSAQAYNARKMLRRRSSLVQDDLPLMTGPKSPTEGHQKGKPTPTMFEEPAPSSLLDSFGF